jgi:hypothetical protein
MERLPIHLDLNMFRSLQTIAAAERDTIDGVIRNAISRDIARRRRSAEVSGVQTARTRAELRGRLAPDFRTARNWADLERRLGLKGFRIVSIADELVLQNAEHIAICNLAMLGHSDLQLLRRFGPRPDHTAQHRFAREV